MSHDEHRGVDRRCADLENAVDLTPYIVSGNSFIISGSQLHPEDRERLEAGMRRTYQTRQTYRMEATFIPPRTELERRNYARSLAWMTLIPAKLKPLIHNGKKPRK